MQSKLEIKERETGAIIEVTLPDGKLFRITFNDKEEFIKVQTPDGNLLIKPCVSNEVKVIVEQ